MSECLICALTGSMTQWPMLLPGFAVDKRTLRLTTKEYGLLWSSQSNTHLPCTWILQSYIKLFWIWQCISLCQQSTPIQVPDSISQCIEYFRRKHSRYAGPRAGTYRIPTFPCTRPIGSYDEMERTMRRWEGWTTSSQQQELFPRQSSPTWSQPTPYDPGHWNSGSRPVLRPVPVRLGETE
jgi:hypothetical protein